jgi:hypothetical protein
MRLDLFPAVARLGKALLGDLFSEVVLKVERLRERD